jgi:pimeloyl-ACP methyl ester carboxylesterase
MGGWTALGYAVTHPDRVNALVMADTAGGLTSPELEEARKAARERQGDGGLLGGALSPGFRQRDPAGAFLYDQVFALNPPRDATPGAANPMGRFAVTAQDAKRLTMPVLFIEGDVDVLIPPEVIRIAAKMVPGAKLEMVADAGHSVYFERPADFNAILGSFLAQVDG